MNRIFTLLTTATLALSLEAMEQPHALVQPSAVDWTGAIFQFATLEDCLKSLIAESNSLEIAANKIRSYAQHNKNRETIINHDQELNKELLVTLARKFTNGNIFDAANTYQTPAVAKYIKKKIEKAVTNKNNAQKDIDNAILAIYAGDEELATVLAQRIRKTAYKNDFDAMVQTLYRSFGQAQRTRNRPACTHYTYEKTIQLLLKLGAQS
jgi:hypothetical protein